MSSRAILVAVCGLMATGCAPPAADRSSPGADELELSAVAVYGRHAAVRGKVDVRLANDGAAPVEVETLQVRHPMFAQEAPTARQSNLAKDGKARIVPVAFGEPRCDVADASGAVVVLGVRTADGVVDVPVPLEDGEPGLVRAHRLACARAAVADAASIEMGPDFDLQQSAQGPTVRTSLRVERRGPGPVAVTELSGNILFGVRTSTAAPLVLPAGQDAAAVEVLVTAARCEAHALTESKTSFTFPLFVSVGDGEPAAVSTTVSAVGRSVLQDLLEQTCGARPAPPA